MAKKNNNAPAEQALPAGYVPTLKTVYKEQVVPALMKQFSYASVMQVPKLVKITINEGVGEASNGQSHDKKLVEEAAAELSLIVGQKAVLTSSRKDISNFHLRKGKVIEIQHNTMTPQPYNRLYQLTGTKGFANKYPIEGYAVDGNQLVESGVVPKADNISGHSFLPENERKALEEKYASPILKKYGETPGRASETDGI